MITITREKNLIKIKLESGVLDYTYMSIITCSDDVHAELLTREFNKKLQTQLSTTRKEYYNSGWKEAKAKKKPKETWFSGRW